MSEEKKRLEQFLLQSRASNIIRVDPRFDRFKPEQIDTIRLRAAQIEAGKKPVSEKVLKQQQKKKRKARRPKQLRGEVSRAIREQKRFERGERRDRPEEEPRIVGEPRNTGLSYDPDIERRRLDIQEQQLRDANLRALADRRAQAVAQERELAVRRGELAAARAERALAREAARPAPAPDIRVEAPRIEGPLITGPLVAAPPALPDPIPEITRLSAQIRADYNAFGQETRERNEDLLRQIREQTEAQQAQAADIRRRQLQTDQTIREAVARQDAVNQELQERIGLGQASMSEARDSVIQEIRDAETRLRTAAGELDQPIGYDDVILRAAQREILTELPEVTPSPSVARPSTPVTPQAEEPQPEPERLLESQIIGGGVVEGGGELQLPSITIPEARLTTAEEEQELRLSPVGGGRQYPRGTGGQGPVRGGAGALRARRLETEESRAQRAARTTPVREPLIESPIATPQAEEEFLSGSPREELPTPSPTRTPSTREEEALLEEYRGVVEEPLQPVSQRIEQFGGAARPQASLGQGGLGQATERVIEDAGIQEQRPLRPLDPDVLFEEVAEAEEVGQVQDQRAQRIRDSQTVFGASFGELAEEVRTGPRGKRGQRGGLGYRVRNNTDRTLKKIQPGDVVNVIGVEEGDRGEGRYRLDTQTQAGTRVSLDQLQPLIDDGSFIFERGNRHELGGHFDENPYGPPPSAPPEEPGLLQQGAEAVGGALASGAGGAARFVGGVAQGAAEGLVAQLPAAGDVGAALGGAAVSGLAGAGRLAAGAAGAVLGGGEEEEEEEP